MIAALFRAFGQLTQRPTLKLVLGSAVLTLILLLALWGAVVLVLANTRLFDIIWLERLIDWVGGSVALVGAWFLLPAVAGAVAGLFAERVAAHVERRYYPGLPPVPGQAFMAGVWTGLRFVLLFLVVNLVAMPAYLLLFFLPPLNIVLYVVLNAWLLGREYFELVAYRRLDGVAVLALRRRTAGTLFLAGAVTVGMFAAPGLNLLAPFIATAFMVHLLAPRFFAPA